MSDLTEAAKEFLPTLDWYPFRTYQSIGSSDELPNAMADFATSQIETATAEAVRKERERVFGELKHFFRYDDFRLWLEREFAEELQAALEAGEKE